MTEKNRRVLVVIPAWNESQNIQQTINGIAALNRPWDLLVVDDGSLDDTAVKAGQVRAEVVRLPFNIGIGGAVSLGLIYARRKFYDAVIRVDADGQHDPAFMDTILHPVLAGEADLCVGSRFIDTSSGYQSSFIRRVGINFFSALISALTKDRVTDPTSGFCAFSSRAVQLFSQNYPSDYPEPEAIVIAKRAGLKFLEVAVTMRGRTAGLSSIRYLKTLYYMIKVTLAIMLNYLRPRKIIASNEQCTDSN